MAATVRTHLLATVHYMGDQIIGWLEQRERLRRSKQDEGRALRQRFALSQYIIRLINRLIIGC